MANDGATRAAAALRSAGRGSRRAALGLARRVRRATHAQGAGESGLGRLIELHAVNTAGDAMVTVALASTFFFSVPVGEARGRVALYLLVTMTPFALMAPVVGPLLDRVRHGRRYAIAATMLARAFLAWIIGGAVTGNGLALYPAAFGVLVASKAYGLSRAATVPRVLPPAISLVTANSRTSLAGLLGGALGGGLAALLHLVGPGVAPRVASVVFIAAVVLALRLPQRVDVHTGEEKATSLRLDDTLQLRLKRRTSHAVVVALRANAALRAFSGFLTMFLAFLLREKPIGGLSTAVGFGLVAGAAGVGSFIGTSIGAWMRTRGPEVVVALVLLLATVVTAAGAWWYAVASVVAVAAVAGLGQQLGKLSLDAVIQRDTAEAVRTSTFARSETLLQLAWVIGGAVGIVLPLDGSVGLGLAALGLAVVLVLTVRGLGAARRERRDLSRNPPDSSGTDPQRSSNFG